MVFNGLPYIGFLALVVLLAWCIPARFRIGFLLIASYVLYCSWSPPYGLYYAPIIFLDTLYFYWLGRWMSQTTRYKKHLLIVGIVTELMLLGLFKYSNFVLDNVYGLADLLLIPLPFSHGHLDLFLPLAISFTNFILISYLVDVYRGTTSGTPSFVKFATYVVFFPHLAAGPIVRAQELLAQFDRTPKFVLDTFLHGIRLLIAGMSIKFLIADWIGPYAEFVLKTPAVQGFDTVWIALYAFATKVYCDFWGYTLMAQGSALMLGYTLPENFNAPYFATNIVEFWRRFHMTLMRWLRDYVYIPLGGSRGSTLMKYRNLFLSFMICGLWHGAGWHYILWGISQGLFITAYRVGVTWNLNRLVPKWFAPFLVAHCYCFGLIFFLSPDITQMGRLLVLACSPDIQIGSQAFHTLYPEVLPGAYVLTVIGLFFSGHAFFTFVFPKLRAPWLRTVILSTLYTVAYFLAMTLNREPQTFYYFQF